MTRFILIGGTYSPPHAGHVGLIESVMTSYAHDKDHHIILLPSADGAAVLGKKPTASQEHRYHMTSIMAQAINKTHSTAGLLSVSDFELILASITELPSYTANTLIVLRQGLNGLLNQPDHLLTPEEQTSSSREQDTLINMRSQRIRQYLKKPTHPYLTADGILRQQDDIILVYGADSLQHMSQWYDYTTLITLATQLYVIPRANLDSEAQKSKLEQTYPALSNKIIVAQHTTGLSPFTSSTQIRQAIHTLSASTHHQKSRASQKEATNLLQSLLKSTVSAEILNYIQDHDLYALS